MAAHPSGSRHSEGPPRGGGLHPTAVPMDSATAWIPGSRASVLLVTGSAELQGEVARASAAAAVELSIAGSVQAAAGEWGRAAAVLLGADVRGRGSSRAGPTIMVGLGGDGALWERAAEAGVDRVAVLPQGAEWLAEFLGQLCDPSAEGHVLGVVGGCGGAGASTLSVLLAVRAAALGIRTLLVDADEWGGGLDVALAAEEVPGLRWPDLLNASGTINPGQLAAALPVVAGCSLLSWGPHAADPARAARLEDAGAEVLRAARRGYELVVVDVGRTPRSLATLGRHCDEFLLVVPTQLRPAVAAARLLAELPPVPTRLVVRGRMREGLDAELIGASVGVPVAAVLPHLRGLAQAGENGRLADAASSRPVRRAVSALLHGPAGPQGSGRAPA
ncbi:septum site-determining protein Ssd [Pseudarthrobacter sp. P1]|uniref:septum site-determining protein Ssd n=1 Tax=Pseudarthrobacter sp. P1 TaxID=3418418 RepID=UPI003CECC315